MNTYNGPLGHTAPSAWESEQHARWLHDEILSEIRVAIRCLEGEAASTAEALRHLLDLDHRLRRRHLEALLRTDDVTVGEILQVHVRRAHSLGTRITSLPPRHATQARLAPVDAANFHHALAVLTANALDAGATSLGLSVPIIDVTRVELQVTDDAGGFDLQHIPDGRALSRMAASHHYADLRRWDVPHGSVVGITIRRSFAPTVVRSESA